MKDIDLKHIEVKIKREIKQLIFKQSTVTIDDMNRFGEKEMKKIRPIKKAWYGWLVSYIPKPIGKSKIVRCIQYK